MAIAGVQTVRRSAVEVKRSRLDGDVLKRATRKSTGADIIFASRIICFAKEAYGVVGCQPEKGGSYEYRSICK